MTLEEKKSSNLSFNPLPLCRSWELILLKIHLFCIQDGTAACPIVLNLLPCTLMRWVEGRKIYCKSTGFFCFFLPIKSNEWIMEILSSTVLMYSGWYCSYLLMISSPFRTRLVENLRKIEKYKYLNNQKQNETMNTFYFFWS